MDSTTIDEQLTALCGQLSGPEPSLDHLSLCDHHPDILALFIERLDDGDHVSTGNLLYSLLKELAALDIPPLDKLVLLNLTHPLTMRCAEKLATSKLSPKTAKSISLSQALLKHLAAGYRTVIKGIGALEGSALPVQQQLTQAMSHALEAQGAMYLKSLALYLGTPRKFWADVHLIYRIAIHCDIPRPQRGNQHITVYCHYYRLLLMACCQPNKLPSSDLNRLYQALPQWSDTIRLIDEQGDNLFAVDTASDLPPFYVSSLKKKSTGHTPACLQTLNLERLINYLEGKLYNEADTALIDGIPRRLVITLCNHWAVESSRQSERDTQQQQTELIYGLSYVHNLLADANFEEFLNRLSPLKTESPKEKFRLQELDQGKGKQVAVSSSSEDIWQHAPDVKKSQVQPAADAMTVKARTETTAAEAYELNTLQASLVNTSAQGACLEFAGTPHPKVVPGDIICCRSGENDSWQVGLARWKNVTPHLLMQLGVEFLNMTSLPRAARILRQNKPAGPYLPAVLLKPEDDDALPPQILLPVMPFKQGDRIHVLGGKRGLVATLSVPIDATGHVSRFTLNDASSQ